MTVGEAIKLLENAGFIEMNHKGSHKKFGKGGKRMTIVMHSSPKEEMNRKGVKELKELLNEI